MIDGVRHFHINGLEPARVRAFLAEFDALSRNHGLCLRSSFTGVTYIAEIDERFVGHQVYDNGDFIGSILATDG